MKTNILILALLFVVSIFQLNAQSDTVIAVPFDQSDPGLPHPTYEGAPITLKAIVRNPQCNSYTVRWDINRNGNYADDVARGFSRNATTQSVRAIEFSYETPNVSQDTVITINVEVRNNCSGTYTYGKVDLFVHDFRPDTNPELWTDKEVEIMAAVANSEAMWFTHKTINALSGGTNTSQIRGQNQYFAATASSLKLLLRNGHLPAYPPGTINNFSQSLPSNWVSENNERWWRDPYAETSMRLINTMLLYTSTTNLNAGTTPEDSTIGYDANQNPVFGTRIAGTRDGRGLLANASIADRGRNGVTGEYLDALVYALPALKGTAVQLGAAQSKSFEFALQQMIDALADAQIDGASTGHWHFTAVNGSYGGGVTETTSFVAVALNNAEEYGASHGLIVNNYVKYRTANAILSAQLGSGAAKRFISSSSTTSIQFTAGMMGVCRWLGVHNFSTSDTTKPFPNEAAGISRGQLRTAYDNYESYLKSNFTAVNARDGINWGDGYWLTGDYLDGDTSGVYYQSRNMHVFSQYVLAEGLRIGNTVLDTVGSYDWSRMFDISLIRAQLRVLYPSNFSVSGRIDQTYCTRHNHSCAYGNGDFTTVHAGNIFTPKDFEHDSVVGCFNVYSEDSVTTCDSLTWINGVTYTSSNYTARDTLTNYRGCDSIISLKLTIKNSALHVDTVVACVSHTWIDSTSYTSSNYTATRTFSGAASNGCDSIVQLHLTINQPVNVVDTQTACGTYTWVDGNTYASNNSSATYTFVKGASNGCDSNVTLNLTILQPATAVDTQSACGTFSWIDGNTYASSNNSATYTIPNSASNGCDSIVTLHLTILQPATAIDTQSACATFTWIDGNTYASSNNSATYTIPNAASNGCDSIVTLNLTILQPATAIDTHSVCGNFTWIDGNTYASNNNSATYTFANGASNGCDSIVTLNLTINSASSSIQTLQACGSYTWPANNMTYNTSGRYTDTLVNSVNCDSVITLNLTINQPTSSSANITACGTYTWSANNMVYSSSGIYSDTLVNARGCDSIVTINLSIQQATGSTVTEDACGSYTWNLNNMTYSSSGTYTHTLTNSVGCDSVVSLNLTITSNSSSSTSESACTSFTWPLNGQTYTTSGVFYDTLTNSAGCDSIVGLNLTINSPVQSNTNASSCNSYFWTVNGNTYDSSGIYTETFTGSNGCDSLVNLVLQITNIDTSISQRIFNGELRLKSDENEANYQWFDCSVGMDSLKGEVNQNFVPIDDGSYAVAIAKNGCSAMSSCVDVLVLSQIETELEHIIQIYPNPTNGSFEVDLGQSEPFTEVLIYSTNGQLVHREEFKNQRKLRFSLDIENAVYFVEVFNGSDSKFVSRLVITE